MIACDTSPLRLDTKITELVVEDATNQPRVIEVRLRYASRRIAHITPYINDDTALQYGREAARTALIDNSWQFVLRNERTVWSRINQGGFWGRGRDYAPSAIILADPTGRTFILVGWPPARQAPSGRAADILGRKNGACAVYWSKAATRGGRRCMREISCAALRVLHATYFQYAPDERDVLLTEYGKRDVRPDSQHLLRASTDALLAASALYAADQPKAAVQLITRSVDDGTSIAIARSKP